MFFFLFAWILPRQEQLHHNFLYSPLIAQHAARSGRVHDYMTLLSRAEKSAAGTAIENPNAIRTTRMNRLLLVLTLAAKPKCGWLGVARVCLQTTGFGCVPPRTALTAAGL